MEGEKQIPPPQAAQERAKESRLEAGATKRAAPPALEDRGEQRLQKKRFLSASWPGAAGNGNYVAKIRAENGRLKTFSRPRPVPYSLPVLWYGGSMDAVLPYRQDANRSNH